jgi:hypothetical protein
MIILKPSIVKAKGRYLFFIIRIIAFINPIMPIKNQIGNKIKLGGFIKTSRVEKYSNKIANCADAIEIDIFFISFSTPVKLPQINPQVFSV